MDKCMTRKVIFFPLSFAQQRLWFLDQFQPGSPFYIIAAAVPMHGPLNVAVLEQSLNEIIRRHEILRTTFLVVDEQPLQVITPLLTLPLPVVDLSRLTKTQREQELVRLADEDTHRPFDLAEGPLLRATLLKLEPTEHLLLFSIHHIVSDDWSMGVFFRELGMLYEAYSNGRASPLGDLPIQFADFACWQRELLQGEVLEAHLSYWKKHMADAPAVLELPTDRPRPPVQTFRGALEPVFLPPDVAEAVEALSQREGSTLFMTLLAAFKTLLYRYTGQTDLVVGSPIANRTRVELEALIGFFVNTLVLRTHLSGDLTFRELLKRVREVTLGAYAHQDLPFEKLVEELQPERNPSYNPLFQVMFVLQNAPRSPAEHQGMLRPPQGSPLGTAKFDLTMLWETAHGLVGAVEYNTDIFDPPTIRRMIGHFQTLLAGIVANPDERLSHLPLLTPQERQQILVDWNDTDTDAPLDRLIHQLFEERVAQMPDAVAVVFEDKHLTYHSLNQRANHLAHHLLRLGIGPEVLVALCLERSLEMVVAVLGVLKAGGAFIPLDPGYPQERLAFMLSDAQPLVLLTQERLVARLPDHEAQVVCLDGPWEDRVLERTEMPASEMTASNLAYMIYTSGSTGLPKGVLVQHQGLCNVITAQIKTWGVGPDSRVLQFASLSFDASVSELFMALVAGARLYIASQEAILPGTPLLQLLRDYEITIVTLPPSVLAALPVEPLPALQTIIVAGEACSTEVVARWSPGHRLFNAYGPTEATIWATGAEITRAHQRPPIGRPIPNTQVYLLDAHLQPVPVGVPGELHIGGVGLARGYHHRPELTTEKFIPHPISNTPGARLYKTGDLARYLPDGTIEFLGRIDHQIKIRGFRIELGEVEAVLSQHPFVREAVVTAHEDTSGDWRLVAYVVPAMEQPFPTGEVRRFLRDRLAEYMLPSAFVVLVALPRTPNGKLDRRALPPLDRLREEPETAYAAPRTVVERTLVAIWQEMLHIEKVGMDDNFFELGGHSLLLVRVHDKLKAFLNKEIALVDIFRHPTIRSLATYLSKTQDETPSLQHVQKRATKQREAISRRNRHMKAGGNTYE
jgi:surfactin family lipopeptide synthetase A